MWEGRGNLMIEYIPEGAKGEWEEGREGDAILVLCTLHILYLFSQETWERNPFKLVVEVGTPTAVRMVCLDVRTPLVKKASHSP